MNVGTLFLVFIFVVSSCLSPSLECLDLLLDIRLPLFSSKSRSGVFFGFGLPVFCLLGRLKRRVFTDGSVGVCVDLLNIFGANTVFEVRGELLLEAV